jgi:hypothetical protein
MDSVRRFRFSWRFDVFRPVNQEIAITRRAILTLDIQASVQRSFSSTWRFLYLIDFIRNNFSYLLIISSHFSMRDAHRMASEAEGSLLNSGLSMTYWPIGLARPVSHNRNRIITGWHWLFSAASISIIISYTISLHRVICHCRITSSISAARRRVNNTLIEYCTLTRRRTRYIASLTFVI